MIIYLNNGRNTTAGRVISFLRFPLIVLILFIHSNFSTVSGAFAQQTVATAVSQYVSGTIAPVALWAFFFISGMLFFHEGTFSADIYRRKLRSRCRTLLLPYVVWNALYIVLLLVAERLTGHTPGIDKPVSDMGVADILYCFFDISLIDHSSALHAPIDLPLWFVRDLMVLALLSPIIYLAVKYYSKLHIYVQTCLLLPLFYCMDRCGWWPQDFATPAVFFAIGAYFSINGIDICHVFRRMDAAFLMSVCVAFYYQYILTGYLLIIFLAFSWLGKYATSGRLPMNSLLERSTFFVFAYHTLLSGAYVYVIKSGRIPITNDLAALGVYIWSPLSMAVTGVVLYYILDRYLPRLAAILTGGR